MFWSRGWGKLSGPISLAGLAATRAGSSQVLACAEPLVLMDEGEDDGVEYLRAPFQFRVLPSQTGNFVIGFGTENASLAAGE